MTANRALMDELGFALKHDERQGWLVIEDGADDRCATITERVLWDALLSQAATVAPAGKALVPLVMTQAMRDVTDGDEWDWPDLLAAAESITEKQHAELSAAAPIAPELDVTKILLNVVPGYEGEGLEIYAKSVDDVVALLTKQGERIEELESRVAAPVAPAAPSTCTEERPCINCFAGSHPCLGPHRATTEQAKPTSIQLTAAEIQSGYSRVRWAEGLIRQLPTSHEGRNSWLLNYGVGLKDWGTPAAPAEPTHLHRADGTLSGVFVETVASEAAAVAANLRNWFDFLPGHAQPTIEQAVRLLETRP